MRLPDADLERFVRRYLAQRERFLAVPSDGAAWLLDADALRARADAFRRTFMATLPDCAFFFAMKSNSCPRLLEILLDAGFGLDASGAPELEAAFRLGARDVVFSGPGKTDAELRLAAEHADRVTVLLDSFGELERLGRAAARGREVRAGVRVSTDPAGLWGKFGVPPGELPRFLREARSCGRVRLEGLQFHTSWNMSPRAQCDFLATLGGILDTLPPEDLARLSFLDVGGGYWPERGEWLRDEAPSPAPLVHRLVPAAPLDDYAREIAAAIGRRSSLRSIGRICFEPGRWICDEAMHLLLSVTDVKGPDLAVVDAGTNAVGWERFESDYCPVLNLTRPSTIERPCRIFGSLCTPHDIFGFSYFGDGLRTGDRLLIPCQGAYTYSLAQNFIKPLPPVSELPR